MLPQSKSSPLRFKIFSAVSKAHQSISSEPLYVYIFLSFLATLFTLGNHQPLTMFLVNTTWSLDTLPEPRVSFAFAHHPSRRHTHPYNGIEVPQMSEPEPYLLVEKCGASRGKPIYVITKHIPSVGVFGRSHRLFHSRLSSLARPIRILV